MARLHPRVPGLALALALTLTAAGCSGPSLPLSEQVDVAEVTTGWYDAGILADGKNKLVPTISLQLRNVSDASVRSVQLNAVFRLVNDIEKEWGTAYVRAISSDGLAAGEATQTLVLQSQLGYTGEQPRHQMLQHSQFADAQVELFGKRGSAQWEKLGEYPVDRQLLTP